MKLNQCPAPASETLSSKKLTARKVCAALFNTLVLTGAVLLFNSASYKPSLEAHNTADPHIVSRALVNEVSVGLSRQRGAFNKAISMLAEGAEADPRLANYYHRVVKRVRWNGTNAGKTNPVHKVAAKAATYHPAPRIAKPESIAEQRDSSSKAEPSENGSVAQQRYTVGDMSFDTNAAIEHWMNYYSATPGGRRTMTIGIGRSDSYLEMARAEFHSAGVPEDLVWLAFVESVWNPRAISPAAAGGIWQFIPSTATEYGLTVQSGNDERTDPLKQTRVAAAYLRDLYVIFGDWTLAMAAYNSGEPRVMSAIVKNGRANFWDLCDKQLLPKETRDYVPKILAAIKIAGQAEDYGLAPQYDTGIATGS